MSNPQHWNNHYIAQGSASCSWYEEVPATLADLTSLVGVDAAVIDVGSGSTGVLVHLARAGYRDLTALDVSDVALRQLEGEIRSYNADANYVRADVREFRPSRRWDIWHDRATFHFLTSSYDRDAYRASLLRSLRPGGFAVIAAFADDGPADCAGLPTVRYTSDSLAAEFQSVLKRLDCRRFRSSVVDEDQRPYVICRFQMQSSESSVS